VAQGTQIQSGFVPLIKCSDPTVAKCAFRAAGDDFSFFLVSPPPAGTFSAVTGSNLLNWATDNHVQRVHVSNGPTSPVPVEIIEAALTVEREQTEELTTLNDEGFVKLKI
jgi:hypothetical protein